VDELSSLALEGKELEDERRAETGSQNSFITLVKANSKVLDKNHANYVKGAKAMDYVIVSKKLLLGPKLDATILGMFKVYAEVELAPIIDKGPKKGQKDGMDTTVGFWNPDQATQFPMAEGAIFDRELPNGHVLQPVHWVMVYLHDFPEIEDALISFRSVGNKLYTDLQKLVKARSSVCTELRFEITHQDVYNKNWDKTDYYPKFEVSGLNYTLTEDGKVALDKSGGMDRDTLKDILTRARQVQSDDAEMRMVTKRNIEHLAGPAPRRALAGPGDRDGYEDEDGGVSPKF
jgi:hypothetical protein